MKRYLFLSLILVMILLLCACETPCSHSWQEANCEAAQTCSKCGKTEGEAPGHKWVEATCETVKYCTVCHKIEGEPLGHKWIDATCQDPMTCSVCGAMEGDFAEHIWAGGSCETADTCSVCGQQDKYAKGHQWGEATCAHPSTCEACGLITGEVADHSYVTDTNGLEVCQHCTFERYGSFQPHSWFAGNCYVLFGKWTATYTENGKEFFEVETDAEGLDFNIELKMEFTPYGKWIFTKDWDEEGFLKAYRNAQIANYYARYQAMGMSREEADAYHQQQNGKSIAETVLEQVDESEAEYLDQSETSRYYIRDAVHLIGDIGGFPFEEAKVVEYSRDSLTLEFPQWSWGTVTFTRVEE